jgi:hypothetical protein
VSDFAAPMQGDGCSGLPFAEDHRAAVLFAILKEEWA